MTVAPVGLGILPVPLIAVPTAILDRPGRAHALSRSGAAVLVGGAVASLPVCPRARRPSGG